MLVIGLTGGIGMGKSTVATQLARLGAKVCNADAIVHDLMGQQGRALELLKKHFPDAVKKGVVDRVLLGDMVFKDKAKLQQLETLLHPLVVEEENHFIRKERLKGTKLLVLDIPLLFETGAEERCDVTMVASAPAFLQRQRVMQRPRMTEEKLQRIIRRQMPDRDKRQHSDVVILTGLGKAWSFRQLATWIKETYAT